MSIFIPIPEELESTYEPYTIVLLRQLKIPDNLRGFRYLTAAITHTAANPSRIFFTTKELYPYVSKQFDATVIQVERNIRTAILIGWERGNLKSLEQMAETRLTKRPTNSFFIQLLANYIRHHYK